MLDTSALIGLHEADPEVATFLAGVLEQHDDGTVPKTHQVVLGELWTGVLAAGDADDPNNPRRPMLDTAASLDIETIDEGDAGMFARITTATNRTMSHNDRWICAAAIRTRSTLITQDADMAEQLDRYSASLDLLDALQYNIRIIYVPRNPEALAETNASAAVDTARMTDEIKHLLSQLDPREAEVLKLRFGLDRGEPRTLQVVADHLQMKPSRIAQIERRALVSREGVPSRVSVIRLPARGRRARASRFIRTRRGSRRERHRRRRRATRRGRRGRRSVGRVSRSVAA